ncbi:MAG: DUF4190 domain-containing protein [Clostridia bacterium]|nr:DUF4190 domain-containing protein [Clostridia bacterium]
MDENKIVDATTPEENGTPVADAVSDAAAAVNNVIDVAANKALGPDDDGKKLSIAALVLGILGIVGGWIPVVGYFTLVLAILGIILGAKGRAKSIAATGKASGMATAGLVLGIIGTALGAVGVLCAACAGAALCAATGV